MSADRVQGQEGARPGVPAGDPETGPGRAQGHVLVPAKVPGQGHVLVPAKVPGQGHVLVPAKVPGQGHALVPAKVPGQGHALVPAKELTGDPPDRGHSAGMAVDLTSANTVNGEAEADRHRNAVLGLPVDEEVEDAVVVGDARLTSNWQHILNK